MIVPLSLAAIAFSGQARAESVTIYARDLIASHNEGLNPITVIDGWVRGVDYPGDWVEYSFHVTGFGINDTYMTAMGTTGVTFGALMTVTGDLSGTGQMISFDFIGSGFEG